MSEARNPEQQPAAHAGETEISDESLEAVSGGLSLYEHDPSIALPLKPVTKPIYDPALAEPTIFLTEG
jgi:hypothetical protein